MPIRKGNGSATQKESTHGWRNPKHTPREELSTETGEETRWWKIYHKNPVSTVTVNDFEHSSGEKPEKQEKFF
jgi:hypothetical protein